MFQSHDGCCTYGQCGHTHAHTHAHEHAHEDTHAQEHAQPQAAQEKVHGDGVTRKIYQLKNLGCAHCAAKMERSIAALEGVEEATITYATGQLRVWGKEPDALLEQYRSICRAIESEVTVEPIKRKREAQEEAEEEHPRLVLISGAVLLVCGKLLELALPAAWGLPIHPAALAVYLAAYLLLGVRVLKTAFEHIRTGQVFDENFLMSLATLGALGVGEYAEAVGVMLFYRVGEAFEDAAVNRSRHNIMDAMDLRPETVQLLQADGSTLTLPAEEAGVGDLLLVRPGDRVPLDGTVLEGESLLDTSAITGEPVPVSVRPGDSILSGCVNTNGVLKLRVDQPLERSMVTRILESVENAAASKPQMDRFITRFSRLYTPFVVALALLVAVIPSIVTGNPAYWIKTACTFLVISCPCALVLSVPLAFFAGIGAGSKQNILFKGGSAMEAISKVKVVVLDKTGTLTLGNFQLQQVLPAEGIEPEQLLALAAGCERGSNHPIAHSICAAAEARGLSPVPFQSVVEHPGQGIEADGLLCGNQKLMEAFHVPLPALEHAMGTQVLLARDGVYLGQLVISDTLKEGASDAVGKLNGLGISTAILTGDSRESALEIAQAVGIDQVRARLLPQEKLEALRSIRETVGPALFVGDGINDAPVLAGADVGAAMGSGADAAIEAADLVFLTGDLEAIPTAIQIGRRSVAIARQNVLLALVVKCAVILLGLAGYSNMWAAVFADTGVAMLCILNSIRTLYQNAH